MPGDAALLEQAAFGPGPAAAALLAAVGRPAGSAAAADRRAAALAGWDPAGTVPDRVRWLAGVCLGAVGRYADAAGFLLPAGDPAGSLAASCRSSHLRQLGRHAEAEALDRLALATAGTAEERADALVGLVADAVGRLDLRAARTRLATAVAALDADPSMVPYGGSEFPDGDSPWRPVVRLAWVRAEVALLGDDPAAAVCWARSAVRLSRHVCAWRHAVKSGLVLGAALDAAGHRRAAAKVLGGVAARAARQELLPLVWPARTIRARILEPRAPRRAERERQQARSAESTIEAPSERPITR